MCTFGALSGQMGIPQVFLGLRSILNTLAVSLNLFTDPRQPDHQLAPCSTELHWMHVVSDHKQTVENKEHILVGPTSVASFSINLHLPFLTPAFHQCQQHPADSSPLALWLLRDSFAAESQCMPPPQTRISPITLLPLWKAASVPSPIPPHSLSLLHTMGTFSSPRFPHQRMQEKNPHFCAPKSNTFFNLS